MWLLPLSFLMSLACLVIINLRSEEATLETDGSRTEYAVLILPDTT